jgi:hypothetical protein
LLLNILAEEEVTSGSKTVNEGGTSEGGRCDLGDQGVTKEQGTRGCIAIRMCAPLA